MYQRDYVLRMIEMIGELITKVLGLLKKRTQKKQIKFLRMHIANF